MGQESKFDVQKKKKKKKKRFDPVKVNKSIVMTPKDPHLMTFTPCVDLSNVK